MALPKGTPVEAVARAVSSEYVRGMCWALAYYLDDCPSWSWLFPYHFAPMAEDMAAALSRLEGSADGKVRRTILGDHTNSIYRAHMKDTYAKVRGCLSTMKSAQVGIFLFGGLDRQGPADAETAAALAKIGHFASGEPTSAISQLLCVLPRSSAHAVPSARARTLMTDNASPLAPSFTGKLTYDTRGENHKWKWTAIFPFASPTAVMQARPRD